MDSSATNSKRRRGLGIVTPNACTECRKKRAKCDGQSPCGRCVNQKSDCVYEVPVRQSKETMRAEIEVLRAEQQRHHRLLAALVSGDKPEQVLDQLRNGDTVEAITDSLEGKSRQSSTASGTNITTFSQSSDQQAIGNALMPATSIIGAPLSLLTLNNNPRASFQAPQAAHPRPEGPWTSWSGSHNAAFQETDDFSQDDVMSWERSLSPASRPGPSRLASQPLVGTWHHRSASSSTPDDTTKQARDQGQSTILGSNFGGRGQPSAQHPYYNQTWTSVTSNGAFVEHLLALYFCWEYPTFASLSKEHFLGDFKAGNPRHCSSLLVNAILALGCRFSSQAAARSDPSDFQTAGNHFFAEAVRILELQKDRHVLTTVQAIGLMSIREASCGRTSQSLFLSGQSIRLAVEMGLHLNPDHGGPVVDEDEQAVRSATFWGAFSLDAAWSLSIGRQPSFSRDLSLVAKPAIVDHIEKSSWIPYTDDGAPLEKNCSQPSNVRSVFKTFCELSELIHQSLYAIYVPGANVTSQTLLNTYHNYLHWYESIPTSLRLGQNFTPAVLFAHMHYHYAILLLFRPFMKLEIISSSVSPRDICGQAADAISALVNSYSQLYGLRRTPSFVPYFVLTASIAHAFAHGNKRAGLENLRQGVADLKQMADCHDFARRALDVIWFLLDKWEVEVDFEEDKQEVISVKDLCKPDSASLNQFCPNIVAMDMDKGIGPVSDGENPLFWIFPLQGRPLLDISKPMMESGFRNLT